LLELLQLFTGLKITDFVSMLAVDWPFSNFLLIGDSRRVPTNQKAQK
jgi:hypothetical protein